MSSRIGGLCGAVSLLWSLGLPAARAGVVLDGSFGPSGALPGPDHLVEAAFGRQVGGNLFHSFSRFDLATGEAATFLGPGDVQNILARVTGGSASSIDGTLRSGIAGANLFLMNPAGVMFGPNAKLEISGSFTATTADYLKLADGGKLGSRLPADDVLTSAPVSAFGFLSPAPKPITATHSTLVVTEGHSLSFFGGDLTLANADVTAPAGGITLFSVRAPGEAPRDPLAADRPRFAALGDISLGFARLDANGSHGGQVVIRGGRLTLVAGLIRSETTGLGNGGNIDIAITGKVSLNASSIATRSRGFGRTGNIRLVADGAVEILDNGSIEASTGAFQGGGEVRIQAGSLRIEGFGEFTGIKAEAKNRTGGKGGDIILQIAGQTELLGTGTISASTFGSGQGGSIALQTARLLIDGDSDISASTSGAGDGGNIMLRIAGKTELLGKAKISANTSGSGAGGSIALRTAHLLIDANGGRAAIEALSTKTATGAGGNVRVQVDGGTELLRGGRLTATTDGAGAGGSVMLSTGRLLIDRRGLDSLTGLAAQSNPDGNNLDGHGGDVFAEVLGSTEIFGGGNISASTFGPGDGGNVTLHTGSLLIQTRASEASLGGIAAETSNTAHGGRGGNISIEVAGPTRLLGFGQISAATGGGGAGGNVALKTGSLTIDGFGSASIPGIDARSKESATGPGGNVRVEVEGKANLLGGGSIGATTFGPGAGGSVRLRTADLVIDGPGSGVFAASENQTAGGPGGDVSVEAAKDLSLRNGGAIGASTAGRGDAGSVTVAARNLLLDGNARPSDTGIFAESSGAGRAGNVQVSAHENLALQRGARLATASTAPAGGGTAGDVRVLAGANIVLSSGSAISASAASADAGLVSLAAGSAIRLSDGSSIAASAGRNGGNIFISARDLFFLDHSSVVATAGTSLLAGARGGSAGTGGNISIDPTFIILDHGTISANAALGAGRNILLQTENFLASESPITATGSSAGTVTITAPELDLSGALATLAAQLVDASTRLQERCTMRLGVGASSFLVVGRGGVFSAPDEAQVETAGVLRDGKRRVRAR